MVSGLHCFISINILAGGQSVSFGNLWLFIVANKVGGSLISNYINIFIMFNWHKDIYSYVFFMIFNSFIKLFI